MASPGVSLVQAKQVALEYFGLDGRISMLGSCQDTNFKLTTDESSYVLKFSNVSTSRASLDFQNDVLLHIARVGNSENIRFPTLQTLINGDGFIGEFSIDNAICFVRVLTFIKGDLLSDFKFLSDDVLQSFGSFIAELNVSLSTCDRDTMVDNGGGEWDMRNVMNTITELSNSLTDVKERERLLSIACEMNIDVLTHSGDFTTQVVHGDLAFYNVIATATENGRPRVSGVIDFGDACVSWVVGDLAIAVTPLLIQDSKPCYLIACDVLRGFVQKAPLTRSEVLALWPLIVQRAVLIYVSISHQVAQDPSNQYCVDELVLNRRILDTVVKVPVYVAQEALLVAAGHEPSLGSAQTAAFLNSGPFQSLLSDAEVQVVEVDVGVAAETFHSGNWLSRSIIDDALTSSEVKGVGVVRYGVPQLPRTALRSHQPTDTIPLQTSVFCTQSTTALLAPFAGSVHVLSGEELVLEGERASVLLRGVAAAESVDRNTDVQAGSVLGVVTSRSFSVQVIPSGLLVSSRDNQQYVNSAHQYGPSFLPPQYCCERDWKHWSKLCPDPFALLLPATHSFKHCTFATQSAAAFDDQALAERQTSFASVQEHYFRHPPVMQRGFQQFLYDRYGRAYLDMVNNVAVVGHSHSAVISAATKQLRLLNTNSRFVYEQLGQFSQAIVAKIPPEASDSLNTVFLVNSGSEATDLALRIARSVVTLRRRKQLEAAKSPLAASLRLNRDVICLEGAYHGVTTASDEVSTTLNDNPNSLETRAPWVHLVPMPNLYRGKFRSTSDNGDPLSADDTARIAEQYVDVVRSKIASLQERGTPPSVFIAEPLSGNAGGVELPPGYLKGVYSAVRSAGGLCIADEVQVGYGRLGNSFWGFQEHDVVPDILTMAKAAGNGHPLGFVVTSKEIAAEFGESEGSFFSSAGGGPVSCAVGLAVLRALDDEDLQNNAKEVGAYLNRKLKALTEKFPDTVGCIHGHGLYQGVELVSDRHTKTPATAQAYAICERLLELGVVCHNTGDHSNVLKVKPPLCFSREDADFFVSALETALSAGW